MTPPGQNNSHFARGITKGSTINNDVKTLLLLDGSYWIGVMVYGWMSSWLVVMAEIVTRLSPRFSDDITLQMNKLFLHRNQQHPQLIRGCLGNPLPLWNYQHHCSCNLINSRL